MTRTERALTALRIEYVARGDRLWARCPFHDDHDPSWFARRSGERAGQYHCFSCQAGGTLLDLVRHVLGCSHDAARAWMGKLDEGEAPGPAEAPEMVVDPPRPGARGFVLPREVYLGPLDEWPSVARSYVFERGLTAAQVARWGLGYAVAGRLAGRLVLVVRDVAGRPCGYMARDFAGEGKRYLYPSANEHPNLDVVFGEQHWPPSGRSKVVVTEGALDALAVERAVGGAVAALGGSQVRPIHLAKLSTFRQVVVLTDSDFAGDAAAEGLAAGLGRCVALVRVRLPQGEDACSVGIGGLREALCATG